MLQDLSKETTKRDRDREIENDRQTDRDIEREICECDVVIQICHVERARASAWCL